METIFVPPYVSPNWQNYLYVNITPYLWVAYRHKPLTGEIVMQMGTKPGGSGEQIGVLKVGFQRSYRALGREERWATEFKNGPVTIMGPNQVDVCNLEISLRGPNINAVEATRAIAYEQGHRLYVRGVSREFSLYTLTVYGHIQISFSPNETAYSEIITQFPQIWYVPEPSHTPPPGPPDPRLSALKPVKPVLTKVTLEEATRAGEAGFEGGSDNDKPSRGRKKK